MAARKPGAKPPKKAGPAKAFRDRGPRAAPKGAVDAEVERLTFIEHLGLTEAEAEGLQGPFDRRTPADAREPHVHVLRLMRSPDYFYYTIKTLFDVELFPFQCLILSEMWHRRFPMLVGSRGVGKSFILAIYALLRALLVQGSRIVICGSGFRQAKTIFNYAETIWHNSAVLRSLVADHARSGPEHGADRWVLRLGDSTITALPIGDGEKIRGERANCIIADEFASIDPEIFETVISGFGVVNLSPVLKSKAAARRRVLRRMGHLTAEQEAAAKREAGGNQLIISGTAKYQFNHFYAYWKKWKTIIECGADQEELRKRLGEALDEGLDHRDFLVFRIPYTMIPEDYYDVAQIARSRATFHAGVFANEFGAVFSADSQGFYPRSLIEACVTHRDAPVLPEGAAAAHWFEASLRGRSGCSYVMGVDPAADRDNFAIVVLECHADHRRVVYCWTTDKERFRAKVQGRKAEDDSYYGYCARKIRQLLKAFPCEVVALDAQGGGKNGVLEALADPAKVPAGEAPLRSIKADHPLGDGKPKDEDDLPGLHMVELVQFADARYVYDANHGMKKDLEDRTLLFPMRDAVTLQEAFLHDQLHKRNNDTLEDCVDEIDELKDELTSITHTQTPGTLRDKWDTPETRAPGSKKGRLRKDRYSALLMANHAARRLHRRPEAVELEAHGGFAGLLAGVKGEDASMWAQAPDWFVRQAGEDYSAYGWVAARD